MNIVINRELARIKYQAATDAIEKVDKVTWARIQQISKLLESVESANILSQTYGDKFYRLYELRRRLHVKVGVLLEVMAECHKAEQEVHQEFITETNNL